MDWDDGNTTDLSYSTMRASLESQGVPQDTNAIVFPVGEDSLVTGTADATSFGKSYNEWVGRVQELRVRHVYTHSGVYEVYIVSSNDLGAVTNMLERPLKVDEVLHDGLMLTVSDVIVQPPGEVGITFELLEPPVPTGVTCDLKFDGDTTSATIQLVLNVTQELPQMETVTLPVDMVGEVKLNVACFNEPSQKDFTKTVYVQEGFSSVTLSLLKSDVMIGQVATFMLLMPRGSDVTTGIIFGDGTEERVFFDGKVGVRQLQHTYESHGIFSAEVSCENHSTPWPTVLQSMSIQI